MFIFKALDKTKVWLLDILLPRSCLGCGREGRYICDKCEIFLSEVPPSKEVFSVWECEGLAEELIWKIKYNRMHDLINELVEKAFEKITLELPGDISIKDDKISNKTYISYVPMYKKREKERDFNQAEIIAKKLGNVLTLSKHRPFKVLPLLVKIKDNKSQVGLSPKERKENVEGVFKFWESFVPRNVLLVDDVYTTGATAKECVRVLRRAGVKNVWVFTLVRKLTY